MEFENKFARGDFNIVERVLFLILFSSNHFTYYLSESAYALLGTSSTEAPLSKYRKCIFTVKLQGILTVNGSS